MNSATTCHARPGVALAARDANQDALADTLGFRKSLVTPAAMSTGDRVAVFRALMARQPAIEGMASILAPAGEIPNLYRVQFDGERRARLRFVHGGAWLSDPHGMLAALLDHWHASLDPSVLMEQGLFGPP